MLTNMIAMGVGLGLRESAYAISDEVAALLPQVLLLLYLWGLGCAFERKGVQGLKNIKFPYFILFIVILSVDAIMISALGDFIRDNYISDRQNILILVYIGMILAILVQLELLLYTMLSRDVYKEKEMLARQYLESQKDHYQYLEKREAETKKFRHDIRNHLQTVSDCLKVGKYAEAARYLESMHQHVETLRLHVSVNNGIADAILNRFYEEAQEEGIELAVQGRFPNICHISSFDICTILSNLLSNAIEAERQCGGKRVDVYINHWENEMFLTIENDYEHELIQEDEQFRTTQKDAIGHGYGLLNVTECVKRNRGHISIVTDNKRFCVKLSVRNVEREAI